MKVDILSRKDQVNAQDNNKDIQMLKEKLQTRRMTAEITMLQRNIVENSSLLEEIQRNNTREHEVEQELKKENSLAWKQDRIIYIDGQIYIPNNKKIKEQILQENHDPTNINHLRQQKMLELVKRNYWWPGVKKDVKKYIQECIKCQQNKVQHQKKSEELHLLDILQELWQEISINIIGPLPKSNGIDAIVVIVNRFTKII